MAETKIDIHYLAHLARLSLSQEEEQLFSGQLSHILQHIEKLSELDVSHVEPTAHAIPQTNVFRPDIPQPTLPHEEALKNAPATSNGLFLVPKIVE